MYFSDAPQKEIDEGKNDESFPSRHSAMAFSGAVFTATLFALRYPNSRYRVPVTAGAFALAGATAALRIGSGSHFTSDVVCGALIGSAAGFIVPFVVTKLADSGAISGGGVLKLGSSSSIVVSPLGISVTRRF
jgi:undecaprenyl-diphosphatase